MGAADLRRIYRVVDAAHGFPEDGTKYVLAHARTPWRGHSPGNDWVEKVTELGQVVVIDGDRYVVGAIGTVDKLSLAAAPIWGPTDPDRAVLITCVPLITGETATQNRIITLTQETHDPFMQTAPVTGCTRRSSATRPAACVWSAAGCANRQALNLNATPVSAPTWDSTGWLPNGMHRKTGTPVNPDGVPVEYDQGVRGGDAALIMTDAALARVHRAHVGRRTHEPSPSRCRLAPR